VIRRRASAAALLASAALAAGGCAARLAATAGAPADPGEDPRVMVTLPASQRANWSRITTELALAHSLSIHQVWRMRSLPVRCVVYDLPPGASRELVLRRLAADPRVETAEPIHRYRTLDGGEDPYAHLQHGARAIRLAPAHRWATGRGVRVAVVDTGVDVTHPDLQGRILAAQNFVDRGEKSFTRDVHGTAVAGVVAASAGNGAGIAGVAPGALLLALKACWPSGDDPASAECDSYTLAKALDWGLAEGAQVLNLSLTGPRDPLLVQLLDAALERGVAVVAAADEPPAFPATHPGVIAVRAAGPGVEAVSGGALAAPGIDILTTVPGGGYEFLSGSSMAAAHVSGVVALLIERRPNLTPAAVAGLLAATSRAAEGVVPAADERDRRDGDPAATGTLVDACGAVAELIGGAPEECARPIGLARGDG
jgi:subtilisin family serine protease